MYCTHVCAHLANPNPTKQKLIDDDQRKTGIRNSSRRPHTAVNNTWCHFFILLLK